MDHNMDSSSSNPNWLVFSLSNNSLFQPSFNNSDSGGVADQENGSGGGGGGGASQAAASEIDQHHLTVLGGGGGPKLEDFLGGSGGGPMGGDGVVTQFDSTMYDDSELKTIAAGFLTGFSTPQNDDTQMQLQVVAPPPPRPTPTAKKASENFGQRTSIFRGVTRHRWTGRYEAHLWDNSCRREGQSRKGRQVYLGGYDKEEKAARAYDLAALKYWGPTTTTNFPVSNYEMEIEEMQHMTRQEFVASLRRKSSGFSRGASIYRGVTRHHQHGRWQARIGRVAGNKDLYLGTFSTQEEAAEAYDIAAIKFRGLNAVTNFDMCRYDVRSIASSNLPIGGGTNKPKTSPELLPENTSNLAITSSEDNLRREDMLSATSAPLQLNAAASINFGLPIKQDQSSSLWAALGYHQTTNAKNTSATTLFQEPHHHGTTLTLQGTTPYSMEFNCNNNEGFFDGTGSYNYQHSISNGTTTHDQDSSNGTIHDQDSSNGTTTNEAEEFGNNGNWNVLTPAPVHSFQAAKGNLSYFQTPIFGIE
ncbi:hypothetical protein ABFS82_10G137600 [Erythranthe guttata]|uniref:AP2-like ethylene-responsive transcription factor AIL5 n=1 Tax=Erythranthe guttata TaxID=4155 RepID=UPI00064DCA26|nr:PREDICTED: AP2-like ethylene-responsive transcription factor AIL5 [Erythranthe guttata]|eukprot:XP_012837609.1 PREDICTED: AP2-like ethylene-responsive transcription factor AIL5 [Erythranthe guttata]